MNRPRNMSERCLLAAVVALAMALGLAGPVGATHELADLACVGTYLPDDQAVNTATDGATVVWNSFTHGSLPQVEEYLIMAARLNTRVPFEVARGDVAMNDPDVDGDLVAWVHGPEEARDIHAWRISSGEEIVVSDATGADVNPQVAGDWVVWRNLNGETVTLLARDTASLAAPVTLASGTGMEETGLSSLLGPTVEENVVYWGMRHDDESTSLFSARLGNGAPVPVDEELPYGQVRSGRLLLDPETSDAGLTLTVIDLATRASRSVTFDPYPDAMFPSAGVAVFDGRYVVTGFITRLGGSTGVSVSLFIYDLNTDSWFPFLHETNLGVQAERGALSWVHGAPTIGSRCIGAARLSDVVPSASRPDPGPSPDWMWFAETEHTLAYGFMGFWEGNGGLPVFGYPLTEEFQERNADTGAFYTTQYFERQRNEWHPENAGTAYEVLLGRLGAELLVVQGRDWTTFPTADPSAPHYFPETGHAIDERFYPYWSSHGLNLGDPGVSFREALALFGLPLSEPMLETNADGDTVLTQYFERAVFEWHPEHAGTPYEVLLRRLGAEALDGHGWQLL